MQLTLNCFPDLISKLSEHHCLWLGVNSQVQQDRFFSQIDQLLEGKLTKIIELNQFTGKFAEILYIPYLEHQNIVYRLVLVGCGENNQALSLDDYLELVTKSLEIVKRNQLSQVSCLLPLLAVEVGMEAKLKLTGLTILHNLYKFDEFKSKDDNAVEINSLNSLSLVVENQQQLALQDNLSQVETIDQAISRARDLGNRPANIVNSAYLAEQANQLATKHSNLTCKIYDEEQLVEMGMGAFLAVSQGNPGSGKLIILEYNGSKNIDQPPYVLVGKGVTFDTGGYSLKPKAAMLTMKYDMCGAASVFASLAAMAELQPNIRVIGVMACAENMISQFAYRVDDIVTSMSGKTIEITNTDAEGRMLLCDALTFCERFNPKLVIDIATLTGACIVALGNRYSGLYANNPKLLQYLQQAAEQSNDLVWAMPMPKQYQKLMKSKYADLVNAASGAGAGSITAACFLANFTEKYPWAHLDVAGTAFEKELGGTGRPVGLLIQFLLNQAENPINL